MIVDAEHAGAHKSRPALTRRGFVKLGGALMVSFTWQRHSADAANAPPAGLLLTAWLEIRHDNTILVRTGRTEIGTGMSAFYAQVVAEELNVAPGSITLLMGDTDKTPDGGYSAGFLSGAANLRKVSAYACQALLGLAAQQLHLPMSALTIEDGIISGGGKRISYGELVREQQLDLKIPISGTLASVDASSWNGMAGLDGFVVLGDPPLKPMSQYKVVGTSHPMPGTPGKVTGKTQWSCDVTLPGMLHARMVRPPTVGAKLISVGVLNKTRFPTTQVVCKNDLVAVLSPNEWEAVSALRPVAAGTRWTEWSGLPGSDQLTKTLRAFKWATPSEQKGNAARANTAFAHAAKVLTATYEQPCIKHAPIGPFVAVADVKSDRTVTVWTHSANSQGLRAQIAHTLSVPVEGVVVRWLDHAGQFGRTTFGGDGAEGDAAILSQLTGKPVRVQWSLQEDLAWSTLSPGWVEDLKAGVDANGRLTAIQSAFYSPQSNDSRLLGAVLAGMPCIQSKPGYWIATESPYDKIPVHREEVYGMPNLGADASTVGLRGNIMRTPGQRQQNFALESLINEAASSVGKDPIEFRLQHTTDQRLIDLLQATAKAAVWVPRPSPHPAARPTGATEVTGRGVSIMVRENSYWVGIAEVAVIPDKGTVTVTHFTLGIECGKIINPRQLERCMKSGVVMGVSEALKEEVTFDKGKVTSTDWNRYKILTMAEMPKIKTVLLSRDDKGFGSGSEGANAICAPAITAAFFDATGVCPRRIPLTPAYVTALLKA
jgi:nicotinate dehydrogenase subunit B